MAKSESVAKKKSLKEKFFSRDKKQKDNDKKDIRRNIISDDTHFSVTEAYKAARTNLMFTTASEKGCKKIIITSSVAKEGKSTTSTNLAITFAQTGVRTLIIEADLRRPKLHQYLDLPNENGMAEYLGGFIEDPHEIVQHLDKYNLDCITGGHIPPNPSELLISPAMEKMLEIFSEEYDYIFVDSPPINIVTDPVSIAKLMTGAIIVVRQNYTTSDSLQQAISALEFGEIKILGYILNSSADMRDYTYNRYKYKYGYRYGGKQYSYRYGYKYGYGHAYRYGNYRSTHTHRVPYSHSNQEK
ncbi:MAG: CpsD/CapB family tyrosine-protein kinase [Ruminococcaceae bacterium]|nr:CpsD/CapB family tyrosine-protein kinase [Oscillospiraceae bacterium]